MDFRSVAPCNTVPRSNCHTFIVVCEMIFSENINCFLIGHEIFLNVQLSPACSDLPVYKMLLTLAYENDRDAIVYFSSLVLKQFAITHT